MYLVFVNGIWNKLYSNENAYILIDVSFMISLKQMTNYVRRTSLLWCAMMLINQPG